MDEPVAFFLRGINLGAKNRVPMAGLRTVLAQELGAGRVATYLQSGNIVCVPHAIPEQFCARLEATLRDRFGVPSPVLHRTRGELAGILSRNPLADIAGDDKRYQVHMCARPVTDLNPADLPVHELERVAVDGREIHVRYGSDKGIHASKLPAALDRRLVGTAITARNIRTLRAVAAMLDAAAATS